jgi:serine/threonine-protein kinase
MGEVWAAHDKTLKRDVAIKILRAQVRRSETALTSIVRFKREVQATCELTHPNTVRVFDYGVTEDGLWYYAMELLEGEHLGSLIRREGPLPPDRAVRLITQAARALAEAHTMGIVHRDVKPANLFVANLGGESDFLKVLDFGLARLPRTSVDGTLTATGAVTGTPSYLSPEVIRGRQADSRSDVYALGAVLYETLCGRPPFESDDTSSLLFAHTNEVPVPPSSKLRIDLPAGLERIVMRCLEKNADARYRSAAELVAALASLDT